MKNENEQTACLVCKADNYLTYSKKGQFGLPTHVVICRNCGFSYLNPRWTKERYDKFYSTEYDHYYRPEIIGQNDERYRYLPVQKIIKRADRFRLTIDHSNVLDIGSGMGHAVIYLRKNVAPGGNYSAIEPSENCKPYLEQNGIKYLSNDVYSGWEKISSKFSFIIMRHVLEHFHDPLLVLQKAREALADDGIMYVAVPDAFHPTKPLRSHFFRIVHISYFSKNSISNLLKKAGLEIIQMKEGDDLEKNEIIIFCKKGNITQPSFESSEFEKQKNIYDTIGKNDLYYVFKGFVISFLRKIRLLK